MTKGKMEFKDVRGPRRMVGRLINCVRLLMIFHVALMIEAKS